MRPWNSSAAAPVAVPAASLPIAALFLLALEELLLEERALAPGPRADPDVARVGFLLDWLAFASGKDGLLRLGCGSNRDFFCMLLTDSSLS